MGFIETDLQRFSIDAGAEAKRLRLLSPEQRRETFTANLAAYTNEVLRDEPVSLPYHYWFDEKGDLFTDSSCQPVFNAYAQFDDRERSGLPKEGVRKAAGLARQHPHKPVFLYSPRGPASFDHVQQNPYSQITFDYGQLYMMFFDAEKINAAAVKLSEEGEQNLLPYLMEDVYENAKQKTSKKENISFFLKNPVVSEPMHAFCQSYGYLANCVIYRDSKGLAHTVSAVFAQIQQAFANEKKSSSSTGIFEFINWEKYFVTEKFIRETYLAQIYQFMKNNEATTLSLKGSCGGRSVSLAGMEKMLGLNQVLTNPFRQMVAGFSSAARLMGQTEAISWDYYQGDCVICGAKETRVGPCDICVVCEQEFE